MQLSDFFFLKFQIFARIQIAAYNLVKAVLIRIDMTLNTITQNFAHKHIHDNR